MNLTATERFHCKCDEPRQHPSPMRRDTCVCCAGYLSPTWHSNDVNQGRFWDRLEDGMFATGVAPAWFENLRHRAFTRERSGRDVYGLRYLSADNLDEAVEEVCDLIVYIALDSLKTIRAEGEDADIDTALTVAAHAAHAFEAIDRLRHKRRGAT